MTPSAVAAGFMAVAAVLFVTRAPVAGSVVDGGSTIARSAPAQGGFGIPAPVQGGFEAASLTTPGSVSSSATSLVPAVADLPTRVANGKLIRDVRLDRYLSAHKEFAGSSVLGVPSGFLRNATADASDR